LPRSLFLGSEDISPPGRGQRIVLPVPILAHLAADPQAHSSQFGEPAPVEIAGLQEQIAPLRFEEERPRRRKQRFAQGDLRLVLRRKPPHQR